MCRLEVIKDVRGGSCPQGSARMILEEFTKEEALGLEAARGRQASFIRRFLHSEGHPGLSPRKVFLAAMHKLLHAVDHVFVMTGHSLERLCSADSTVSVFTEERQGQHRIGQSAPFAAPYSLRAKCHVAPMCLCISAQCGFPFVHRAAGRPTSQVLEQS